MKNTNSYQIPTLLSEACSGEYGLVVVATKHTHWYAAKRNYQNVPQEQVEAGVGD